MKMRHCLVACVPLLLAGCGVFDGLGGMFSGARAKVPQGYTIASDYPGLTGQSVAIVVHVPRATLDEFTGARQEISDFVVADMRQHMPTTQLVAPREVIAFQDDTLNWASMPQRDLGRHFSVQKMLYIEVLDYSTRPAPGYADMQGHLRATCTVVDCGTEAAGAAPAWKGLIDVRWPAGKPLDPTQTNESAVRLRLLEAFADRLVRCFYAGGAIGPDMPG